MKKRIIAAAIAILLAFCTAAGALADDDYSVVGLLVTNKNIVAYVEGSNVGISTAMLGQTEIQDVECSSLTDEDVTIDTLIIIDNSLSIPEPTRPLIAEELKSYVASRESNERFGIATIGEEIDISVDFTNNIPALQTALDELEYHLSYTLITDALYNYLNTDPFAGKENTITRILLIGDGTDDKDQNATGVSTSTLSEKLGECHVQLTALGINNADSSNGEELKNMYNIATRTGGDKMAFSELESGELTETMAKIRNTTVVKVPLTNDMLDGSLKTLTLQVGSTKLSIDNVRMEAEIVEEGTEEEPEPEEEEDEEPEEEGIPLWLILAISGIIIVVIIIVVIVVNVSKKKEDEKFVIVPHEQELVKYLNVQDEIENANQGGMGMYQDYNNMDPMTGGIPGGYPGDVYGETMGVWRVHSVTLTDINSSNRSIRKPIESRLLVGRSAEADIRLENDGTPYGQIYQTVSNRHFEILRDEDGYYINNLSNSNGTKLNGVPVIEKTRVNSGDIIKMGNVEMRIDLDI